MGIFKPKNTTNWHYRFNSEGRIRTGAALKVFGLQHDMLVHEMRERDIQNLITNRFREGNTAATIIYELVFISQVLKHVKRLGYVIPIIDFAELKKANKLRASKG